MLTMVFLALLTKTSEVSSPTELFKGIVPPVYQIHEAVACHHHFTERLDRFTNIAFHYLKYWYCLCVTTVRLETEQCLSVATAFVMPKEGTNDSRNKRRKEEIERRICIIAETHKPVYGFLIIGRRGRNE